MSSKLFSPVALRDLKLDNRLVVAPMCQYSADDGSANDWHMMHLGTLANSGAGLMMVEATHIEREGRITHGCLGLYSDENEAALKKVVEACRKRGSAKLGIQLSHAGRKASAKRPWEGAQMNEPELAMPWQTKSPSAIPFGEGWHIPHAFTAAEVEALLPMTKELLPALVLVLPAVTVLLPATVLLLLSLKATPELLPEMTLPAPLTEPPIVL